jgi:hypothetical protein
VSLSFDDFFAQRPWASAPAFMAVFMTYSFAALGARRYAIAGRGDRVVPVLAAGVGGLRSSCVAIALERSSLRAFVRRAGGSPCSCSTSVLLEPVRLGALFQSYGMPSDLGGYKYEPPWDGIVFILRDGRWGRLVGRHTGRLSHRSCARRRGAAGTLALVLGAISQQRTRCVGG